ncbi:MAG: histidinol-phosphate transaminase [Candidatus Omnitrophica bacterium]|nr:histidinol-phosphate transaminase [Candidatus Omnitrophota bacterium]
MNQGQATDVIQPRKAIQKLTPYQPGKPIEEVQRELGLTHVVKLASNENALGPSPKAVAAVREALAQLHRYPDGQGYALKRKLASHLGVDGSNIILGNGSDELITLALRTYVDPGDEIVVADPTFLIYRLAGEASAATVRTVPLRDFRYDLPAIRRAVNRKTKIVFIANPDNPTGSFVTASEVSRFMEDFPDDVLVVFDEAYFELADVPEFPQSLEYVKAGRSVLVTRTFSKAYGLSGLRIGYGIAPSGIVQALNQVREPFNVNSLAQAAAAAALDDKEHLEATVVNTRMGRKALFRAFDALGIRYVPSAANFVLFQIGARAREIARSLLKRGIIVREMGAWNLDGFLRVTVGTAQETEQFISELRDLLTSEKGGKS